MGVSACSLLNACRTLRLLLLPVSAWSARRFFPAEEILKANCSHPSPLGAMAKGAVSGGVFGGLKRLCPLAESQALISGGKSDWTG